jgi:ABC-type nitrate/sulfonate/bicarbonate transport system substrate-binding protein
MTSPLKARARHGLRVAAGLTLVAGLLAACSSGNAGATVEADEETGNRSIRVALPFISTMNSAVLYGQGSGIFEKHGIEMSFIEVDGARGLAATLGGSVDMVVTSAVNPLAALEQGQEIPVIAQIGNGFPESVIVTTTDWTESGLSDDSPWEKKMEFLRNKPWGVSSPQGSSSYMARYMFQLAGFSADDFNMKSLGSASATLAAVEAETVTAGSMGAPNPQVAEAEGYAKVFISVAGGEVPELQNTLTSVVAVSQTFFDNNPELIADFKTALAESQEAVYADSATVDEWMYTTYFEGSPKEAVLQGVEEQREGGAIARTPAVDPAAAEKLVTFMRETGQEVPDDWRNIFVDLN